MASLWSKWISAINGSLAFFLSLAKPLNDSSSGTDDILLEYGRLIDFVLPGPTDNGSGVIFDPPFTLEDYSSSMDTLQLEMINQSEIQN